MFKKKFNLRNGVLIVAYLAVKKVTAFQKHQIVFIGMILCIILSACSSPESDGIKAAQKLCDCVNDSHVNGKNTYDLYIKEFNSYAFNTRIEARKKLDESRQEVFENLNECVNKANTYRNKLESKYKTNKEKTDKFQYAYNAHRDVFMPKETFNEYDYFDRINSLILTIIPPKPDLEKLKKDLLERTIYKKDIYFIDGLSDELSIYARENFSISVVLAEDLSEALILSMRDELNNKPFVKSTDYISKEQALLEMQRELGENPEVFLGYNPFQPSIDIRLKSEYIHPDSLWLIEKHIKSKSGVSGVNVNNSLLSLLTRKYVWYNVNMDELKEVEILNVTDKVDKYHILVHLRLERQTAYGRDNFIGNVNITYELGIFDDWDLMEVETEN